LENLDIYLRDIINNPDQTNIIPFVPQHTEDFKQLVAIDPALKAFFSEKNEAPAGTPTTPPNAATNTANTNQAPGTGNQLPE